MHKGCIRGSCLSGGRRNPEPIFRCVRPCTPPFFGRRAALGWRIIRGDQGHLMLGERIPPQSEVIRAMFLEDGTCGRVAAPAHGRSGRPGAPAAARPNTCWLTAAAGILHRECGCRPLARLQVHDRQVGGRHAVVHLLDQEGHPGDPDHHCVELVSQGRETEHGVSLQLQQGVLHRGCGCRRWRLPCSRGGKCTRPRWWR